VLSDLLQSSFAEAVTEQKLNPAGGPRIEPIAMAPGEGLTFRAICEILPGGRPKSAAGPVAGRPVAVLYTDTGAAGALSSAWTSPVEVLVRHAGRCLEGMAVSRGAHAKAASARVGMPA